MSQRSGDRLPADLRQFIDEVPWTYARTMPDWPHEYIVRQRVDDVLCVRLVQHIREHGYPGRFYQRQLVYFEEDGLVYWTMGEPVERTTIINRCLKEATYEARLAAGTLPPPRRGDTVGDARSRRAASGGEQG